MSSQSTDGLKITSRVTLLEPGMYIFRYASQTSTDKTVCIALQQAPLGKGLIDFFPAEGVSKNMLTKLGDCIIGRVKNGVTTVLITEYHLANVQVDPVDLRIDRIDTSAAIMRNFAPTIPAKETSSELQPAVAPGTLKLIGHIQSRGDVTATQEWLGERQGTTGIEGFLVDWADRPDGVDLVYTSTVAGSGPSPKVLSGHYCGTRGKATPLIAVGFSLTGPNSSRYRLAGEVAFTGAEPQPIVADQMFFGPSGQEPLVGIKLSIFAHPEINAPRYKSPWENLATTQTYSHEGQLA